MNQCTTKRVPGALLMCALFGFSLTSFAATNTDELDAIQPQEGCYAALRGYLTQEQTQFDDTDVVPGGAVVPVPVPVTTPVPAPTPEGVSEPAPTPEPVAPPAGTLATDDTGAMETPPAEIIPTPQDQAQGDAIENTPQVQAIMEEHKDDSNNAALIAGLIAAGIAAGVAAYLAKKWWDKRKKAQKQANLKISAPTGFKKVGGYTPEPAKPTTAAEPEKTSWKPTRPTGPKPATALGSGAAAAESEAKPTTGAEPDKPTTGTPAEETKPTSSRPSLTRSQSMSSLTTPVARPPLQRQQSLGTLSSPMGQKFQVTPGQAGVAQTMGTGTIAQPKTGAATMTSGDRSSVTLSSAALSTSAQATRKPATSVPGAERMGTTDAVTPKALQDAREQRGMLPKTPSYTKPQFRPTTR